MSAPAATGRAERGGLRGREARTERWLLLLAAVVVAAGAARVGLGVHGEVPVDLWPQAAVLLVALAAAHVVLRRLQPAADPVLLPVAAALNGLGLVMLWRLDLARAGRDATELAGAQLAWTVVGLAAFVAAVRVLADHRVLDRYRYTLGLLALGLLVLPSLPVIGREINGARLWVELGPMTMQPAELAKVGLVVFFASYLAGKGPLLAVATQRLGPLSVPPLRAFGPLAVIWAASLAILVLQNDFGLSALVLGAFVATLYVATGRLAYPAGALVLFAGGAVAAAQLFPHVATRLSVFLDVWGQYEGAGYQLAQSLFGLASGGMTGAGWGEGHPDLIPFVHTDFIFAAFGEELGLLGATALLLCFVLLLARGYRAAMRADDEFGTLLAAGLTALLAIQVFVIVGGTTRLIPLTGLTLPLVSYGGSSLLSSWLVLGALARISAGTRPPRAAEGPEPAAAGRREGSA